MKLNEIYIRTPCKKNVCSKGFFSYWRRSGSQSGSWPPWLPPDWARSKEAHLFAIWFLKWNLKNLPKVPGFPPPPPPLPHRGVVTHQFGNPHFGFAGRCRSGSWPPRLPPRWNQIERRWIVGVVTHQFGNLHFYFAVFRSTVRLSDPFWVVTP